MLVSSVIGRMRRPLTSITRSMYTAKKLDTSRPNWLRVGLALGSTVAIWTLLIKQHNDDVAEYKRRNELQ